MFQLCPIQKYLFAGSKTLAAFEQLSRHATIACGADLPSTPRTPRAEAEAFLHLQVRANVADSSIRDVLINDISGEIFTDAIADQTVCESLGALYRADHLVVLLDGKVLADTARRHEQRAAARDFLTRAVQTDQVGPRTSVHIVVAKFD